MNYKFAWILFTWVLRISRISADTEAEVSIVTAGYCSREYLQSKGVDTNTFRQVMDFNTAKMSFVPAKPIIPGCMRVVANNVTIREQVNQITADFEMRISNDPDPNKPTLKCKQNDRPCGCGSGKHSCSYCDMCKNIEKAVKNANINVNSKKMNVNNFGHNGNCNCNILPGTYDIDIEVCTPDENELANDMPQELQKYITNGAPFSLFTTMLIYNFRFNVQNDNLGPQAIKAFEAKKARGLIGCYILGSNIAISAGFSQG